MTDTTTAAWDQFIHWAKKFDAIPGYLENQERLYKLDIANRIQEARDSFHAESDDWIRLLRRSFTYKNNLVNHFVYGEFLRWIPDHIDEARVGLDAIWNDSLDVGTRFDQFALAIPRTIKSASPRSSSKSVQVSTTTLASFLHMANDATAWPIYRPTQIGHAYAYTGFDADPDSSFRSQYLTFIAFLDRFIEEAAYRDLIIRDRLDAQGLMWVVTYHSAPGEWSEADRQAFHAYRGLPEPASEGDGAVQADESPSPDRQSILDAMATFDAELRDTAEWSGWEEREHYRYAILHESQRYPVKKIYSLASGTPVANFITDEARRHVMKLGFEIVVLPSRQPTVWWVNQGATFQEETDRAFLRAPKRNELGHQVAHWEALAEMQPQDIVLQYFGSAIQAAALVENTADNVSVPYKEGFVDGRQVDIESFELATPISLNDIPLEMRISGPGLAFNSNGNVNLGYVFRTPGGFLYRLIERFPDRWPPEIIERAGAEPDAHPVRPPGVLEPYVEPPFTEILESVRRANFRIEERRLQQYHLALKTRGFVILAGPSGTGKTWLTRVYADAVGARHEIVAVAPNWTTNEDLLGFHNPMTGHFHDTAFTRFLDAAALAWDTATAAGMTAQPYHLVLDEMNLARVEYYFAEFLSRMELRARGEEANIPLGPDRSARLTPNLRVIGTVNIDETTHGFADKVYDRAQLLVLDVTRDEVETHLAGKPYAADLLRIWEITAPYRPFAFRVLDEIGAYIDEAKAIEFDWSAALDDQVLHKILPKLNGHDPVLGEVLSKLVAFLQESGYPLSHTHADRMLQDYTTSGIASYFR